MHYKKIQEFRTVLREFERDVAIRQKRDGRTGGLSVVQCHTIINLGEFKETTIGHMADKMGVDKSTLSRTIDGLVAKNLVVRIPHPNDRRYLIVKLSSEGKKVCDQLNTVNNQYIKDVFGRIPETEHETVLKYFNIFVSAMREENLDR